ncbi:MAG TPA: hypothetical protein VFU27_00415 [Terriglobales bacterium]|nr:hypothetical protein [Terriglobales bacterium]
MEISSDTDSDIRMGVWSHFYNRFWSEWFIFLVIIAVMGTTAHVAEALRHRETAFHNAMLALVTASVVAAVCFHKYRIMRLLQRRELEKRLLGEMASVVCSLALMAIIGTMMA